MIYGDFPLAHLFGRAKWKTLRSSDPLHSLPYLSAFLCDTWQRLVLYSPGAQYVFCRAQRSSIVPSPALVSKAPRRPTSARWDAGFCHVANCLDTGLPSQPPILQRRSKQMTATFNEQLWLHLGRWFTGESLQSLPTLLWATQFSLQGFAESWFPQLSS